MKKKIFCGYALFCLEEVKSPKSSKKKEGNAACGDEWIVFSKKMIGTAIF